MDPERLCDRGPEAVRLDQHGDEGADLGHPRSVTQVAQRLLAGRPRPDLEAHQRELLGEGPAHPAHLLTHLHEGLVQPQSRLHTDHHQIERVGKRALQLVLPAPHLPLHVDEGDHPAQEAHPGHEQEPLLSGHARERKQHRREPQGRRQDDPRAQEDHSGRRAPVSGVKQHVSQVTAALLSTDAGPERLQEGLELLLRLPPMVTLPPLVDPKPPHVHARL